MWICLNDAFLSIVTDTTHPDQLLVRARRRDDIERVFGETEVIRTIAIGSGYLAPLSLARSLTVLRALITPTSRIR